MSDEYEASKRAWMTSLTFEKWIRKRDSIFESQGWKVVFVIDNCPAHPKISNLKTTSKTQLMHQGVIHNLKLHYRQRLLQLLMLAKSFVQLFWNLYLPVGKISS